MEQLYTKDQLQKLIDDADAAIRNATTAITILKEETAEYKREISKLEEELRGATRFNSELRMAEQSALAERNEAREDEKVYKNKLETLDKKYYNLLSEAFEWQTERGFLEHDKEELKTRVQALETIVESTINAYRWWLENEPEFLNQSDADHLNDMEALMKKPDPIEEDPNLPF